MAKMEGVLVYLWLPHLGTNTCLIWLTMHCILQLTSLETNVLTRILFLNTADECLLCNDGSTLHLPNKEKGNSGIMGSKALLSHQGQTLGSYLSAL